MSHNHTGRGNKMPERIQSAILEAIQYGRFSVSEAARLFGYNDRSVYRAAKRNSDFRSKLNAAVGNRAHANRQRDLAA